ncbi:hypothetical protein MHYP_G00137290 [Metynnis hypsauchen]
MANVKVAVRVRPLNSRECVDGGRIAVQVEDKVVRVRNVKLDGRLDGRAEAPGDSRERLLEFGFDYCYWSVNPEAPNYASQEEVFHDLGVSVLAGAAEGYNICLFAYGQTGSGKTYTMMGTPDSTGLTPRICQGLFQSDMDSPDGQNCRVEISFLEIYNERVRDLLRGNDQKKPAPLRVREHPEKGPYVQGLSQHVVSDYKQAEHLLKEGISNRITAATHVHDASSRSHAIFSIQYTQAILENNLPSEIVSKINLVDLAGSERADPHYCRDRITEGANINKSLVTLGIVISALAQNSQMCSSSQSINSMLSEGDGSTVGSHSSSLSSSGRRHCFIPYRDSVLTWLLKDSLGGNSKTIMIATISPSYSSYNETLSTLRYAAHARNIVNKPRVNEDANVRLIRELREEIDRLKSMLLSFSMRNPSPSLSDERDGSFSDIVLQNEIKVEQLTKDWSDSWHHKRSLLEEYSVDINENRAGVQIHSLLPHLISLEPDVLSTGVTIYHLRHSTFYVSQEGVTRIGPQDQNEEEPHIEGSVCEIENQNGVVTLRPLPHSICMVNDREVTETCRLAQGAVITVGVLKFRFNHPAEAAVLRERRRTSEAGLLCDSSFSTFSRTVGAGVLDLSDSPAYRQRLEEQQCYVECLWEKIQVEQRRAEKDLEREQAHLRQQHTEIQQWILQEKQRLTAIRERGTLESGVQTDLVPLPVLAGGNQKALDEGDAETVGPSLIVGVGKQVVQEELLKHHALRRAENRIRRKRLHYQLERIARKRHLLEAKRELQRLENTLSFGVDGPSSPELGSPSKCRGHPLALRRHSFSAELLSRLYPQHTPIFRKWVSDECLPDRKTRGRSNTMPSRYSQGTSSMMGSSENLKTLPKDDGPSSGMTERTTLASNPESSVWNPTGNHNASSQSALDSNNCDTKKVLPIIKQSSTQKSSAKGGKTFAHGRSKGLETIRKALSRSVGSGIKTALSRVFRKPPLGLRGGRGAKSSNRAKAQFVGEGNKDNIVGNMETKQQKCFIKTTVSCEGLEHLTSIKDKTQKQRRWHSAEALTHKTKKWVRMQQELTGCVENDEEEIDGSSDCDSLFSVDSLSSAYAIALAEQLQQEECEPSEAESEDSQMSKDSLVMESSGKHITARPAQKPSYSLSHSFHPSSSLQSTTAKEKIQKSKEMPAEVFWKINGNPKPERQKESQIVNESSHTSELVFESRPSSNASVKDPENFLALTDAWSSTDAADSPRSLGVSEGLLKRALHKPAESNSRQSATSLDRSITVNESEGQRSPHSDSTEGETLEEQSQASSDMETNLDSFWSDPTSTLCSTHENTFLHESSGLLSNCKTQCTKEACTSEKYIYKLYTSASTDIHGKDASSSNSEVPPESEALDGCDVNVVNAYSKDREIMPGSSGCSPDKSLCKDMQSSTPNQTLLYEERVISGTFAPSDSAVVEEYEAMKVDSFSISRDTTGKLSSKEKEMSVSLSSACERADLQQDSKVPSLDRNTVKQNNSKCALGAAFIAPEQKKSSSYLVNENDISMDEVKYDTAPVVEVTDKGIFDDRKCGKIDPTINEKISEVVKEHLNMSLTVERGSNFSEVSSSPKESCVLQVLHPVEYCIASEMHNEVANSESFSKGYMTSEFNQDMEVSTVSKSQENECSFKSVENFQATDSRPFNNLAHERCSPLERSGNDHICNTQNRLHGEQGTDTSCNIITRDDSDNKPVDLINNTCSGELNKENTISNSSQALLKSCTSSQPSNDDQTYQITQRVTNGAYNSFRSEDQSVCGGEHKNYKSNTLGQSRDIQGAETLRPANQVQAQESTICVDFAVWSEGGNHTERREANKPDLRSSTMSEKTRPLNITPKEHQHKPESTEKATGVEDHARVAGARLNHCSHNDDRQRLKTKKYRRAHFRAPLSSSTDSADSSFDEISKTRVHHCSTVTRAKPSTAALGRPNIVTQSRARNVAPDEPHTSLSSVIGPKATESIENHCLDAGSGEEVTTDIAEKKSHPRQRQSHLTAEISNSNSLLKDETVRVIRSSCSKQISHEHTPGRTQLHETDPIREPTLHFASSDINPFIHAIKSDELLKAVNRHQAFGSAVNISSQLSQIEDCDKRITRCCSVDNGLNIQNSPFNSHLSTYANHKGLSSTLSSVEDSRQHISTESQLKEVCHTLVSSDKTLAASSSDCYNDTSDLGHSSGQVDEIVLVYSSEHETQESSRKCDHGTQTIMFDEDLKKKSRHRRSNTQVPVSRQAHGTSTTWASLQNMSEHLSELILNTSDLLGNIQCMRTADKDLKYEHPLKTCSKVLKVYSDGHCKRDGSTQTAVDIGIQTEAPFLMKQSKVIPESPSVQNPKAHEVNVIVKVIGSDICNDSNQTRIKCIRDQYENRQSFEVIKSMPDLRHNTSPRSEQLSRTLDVSASKVLSLETVVPNQNFPDPKTLTGTTVDRAPVRQSSNCFGDAHNKCTSDMLARDNQAYQMRLKTKNCPDKQVLFMDRASSPILTVEVLSRSQNGKAKSAQSSSNHKPTKMYNPIAKQVSKSFKNPLERKQMSTTEIKALAQSTSSYTYQNERVCQNKSVSSVSLENFSDLNCTNGNGSDVYSEIISLSGRCTQNGGKKRVQGVHMRGLSQPVLHSPLSSCTSSDKHRQHEDRRQNIFQSSTPNNHSYRSSMLKHNHRLSQDSVKCWSDRSKSHFQYQEEDVVSLAPSECNTDILVSIDPLVETNPLKEDQWIPEDLPVHNKFTNWSGINQQSPARLSNDCNPSMDKSPESSQPYSAESRHKPQPLEGTNRKTSEIERLRKEREQVLASVRLDMSPQQLSVELTEAKLHYGLGQTDTLLKMLQSSPREESAISAKQQLYDRHRRSIDGLRKEREARLQSCRRARSLSPSKHPNSSSHETEKSQRPSDLPSRRREYLQQLRQEIVQMSRVPDPPRREGQCPSDIELLLRDYSRAREEARTEIARARERLRERTEQEKRRLQQQALAQAVKDNLRRHTRFSNSTLCTGSNLSLSSGPTSGYNSSNAAVLKDSTSPSIQITGVSEVGLRVRTRPPMIPSQSLKAPRAWLSAQDIRLDTSSSGFELLSSSSPSSPPARQRTFSFGSPSSLSTSYQDIADCTLASAISEVQLASGGDLRNLLAGKAAAGWRHQGMERGVQTFHRPSSRPSAHGFLGAVELERPLASLWCLIRDHSKTHLYNESLKSAWTRPLDDSTQLVYLLTDPSNCELKQPRDFCCLSTESKQDDMWVLAIQSVFEESLPRPSVDTIRGEMLPSAWILQPSQRQGQNVVIVIYLLQVDLGTPSLPQRLLSTVTRKQAAVIADLDSFFSIS